MLFLVPFAASILIAPHEERAFVSWMRTNNVLYTGSEYHLRLGIYLTNARYVSSFNAQRKSYTLSLNRFAASTDAEYRARLSSHVPSRIPQRQQEVTAAPYTNDVPDELDWREKGVCNPPCDQLECASGWAFACVAAQEGQWKIYKGELMKLSEQELLCCDFTDFGCEGGLADSAAYFVLNNQKGQWMLDSDYPYTGVAKACEFDESKGVQFLKEIVYAKTTNEQDMKEKCAKFGLLAVSIDGSRLGFKLYHEGVYDDEYCDRYHICHSVTIVGYGTQDGKDYWLCRNSYGAEWGEQGYIKMRRNAGGQCGIDLLPYLPIVK